MITMQLHPEHTVILSCSSLLLHAEAAQTKMHTRFPVAELDRQFHAEPKQMRSHIPEVLDTLPASCETVLAAMVWGIAEAPGITSPFPDVWSSPKWTIASPFCFIRMTRLTEI